MLSKKLTFRPSTLPKKSESFAETKTGQRVEAALTTENWSAQQRFADSWCEISHPGANTMIVSLEFDNIRFIHGALTGLPSLLCSDSCVMALCDITWDQTLRLYKHRMSNVCFVTVTKCSHQCDACLDDSATVSSDQWQETNTEQRQERWRPQRDEATEGGVTRTKHEEMRRG